MSAEGSGAPLNGRKVRSRKDRPCDMCRRKKVRCFIEAGKTACALCRAEGFDCTFHEQPSKRQRSQSASANVTAAANRQATFAVEGSSGLSNNTHAAPIDLRPDGAVTDMTDDSAATGTDEQSVSYSSPSSASSPAEPTLNLYDGSTVQYVGLSGDNGMNYLPPTALVQPVSVTGDDIATVRVSDSANDPIHFRVFHDAEHHTRKPSKSTPCKTLARNATTCEIFNLVHPHGPTLIKLYYRLIHPIFPILNRSRTESQFILVASAKGKDVTDPSVTPMVAAILVAAAHWWSFDPSLYMHPQPHVTSLREFVRNACKQDVRMPRLVVVQTFLLEYALLSSGAELHPLEAWADMASMVSTAQNIGLHQNPERWKIQPWEIRMRKKLWWAVFVTEKWLAHSLGRTSHIHFDDWNVPFLNPSDFEEQTPGADHFMCMASLTYILSDTLHLLYSPRTVPLLISDLPSTLNIALPLLERCNTWFSQLPSHLTNMQDEVPEREEEFNANGSLYLAYFVAKISLHRAIMRCSGEVNDACRLDAENTMRDIARWSKSLTATHILSLWFSHSRYNFTIISNFMLALLFTARSEEEFSSLHAVLQKYRWSLRVHSNLFPNLVGSALRRIDAFCLGGMEEMLKLWRNRAGLFLFQFSSNGATAPSSPRSHPQNSPEQIAMAAASDLTLPHLFFSNTAMSMPSHEGVGPTDAGLTSNNLAQDFRFEDFMMTDIFDGSGVDLNMGDPERDQFANFAMWGLLGNGQFGESSDGIGQNLFGASCSPGASSTPQ